MEKDQDAGINITLTDMEMEVIKAIKNSDFYENGEGSVVWDYSVYDLLPFKGKVRSGVMSSLQQKGVVHIDPKERGDIAGTIYITEKGYSLLRQLEASKLSQF